MLVLRLLISMPGMAAGLAMLLLLWVMSAVAMHRPTHLILGVGVDHPVIVLGVLIEILRRHAIAASACPPAT